MEKNKTTTEIINKREALSKMEGQTTTWTDIERDRKGRHQQMPNMSVILKTETGDLITACQDQATATKYMQTKTMKTGSDQKLQDFH